MDKESVLLEAERLIHGEKRQNYGSAKESFQNIAAGWSVIIGAQVEDWQVALCMDWLKTCRHLTNRGRDDLVDKGGYTGLCAQIEGIDE